MNNPPYDSNDPNSLYSQPTTAGQYPQFEQQLPPQFPTSPGQDSQNVPLFPTSPGQYTQNVHLGQFNQPPPPQLLQYPGRYSQSDQFGASPQTPMKFLRFLSRVGKKMW